MSLYERVHVGQTIDDAFIEGITETVLIDGYDAFAFTEQCAKVYSCDGDEDGTFYEAMYYATGAHGNDWEVNHEYDDVQKHVERWITDSLQEANLIARRNYRKLGVAFNYTELVKPLKVNEHNLADVHQALSDAAHHVTWAISESYQTFFQTLNPLAWNGESPQERYGEGWIEDTETRLICMVENINDDVLDRVHNNGHTLTATITRNGYTDIREWDTDGDLVW